MPRLSIVIPCLGNAEQLENTLVSVLQHRPDGCEVLVVHSHCYHDPYNLKDEVRFVELCADATLPQLINAGIEAAQGEVLHLLQCGLQVEEGWTAGPLGRFADPLLGAASPLLLYADNRNRILAAGIAYGAGGTRRVLAAGFPLAGQPPKVCITGPTLWAGFYRRTAIVGLGGLDPNLGELADVDLALSLKAIGYRILLEPASRIYAREPSLNSRAGSFEAGRRAERLFWRHAPNVGWLKSLLLHPFVVAASFLTELPHLEAFAHMMGRAAACLEIRGYWRHYRRLHKAPRPAAFTPLEAAVLQEAEPARQAGRPGKGGHRQRANWAA